MEEKVAEKRANGNKGAAGFPLFNKTLELISGQVMALFVVGCELDEKKTKKKKKKMEKKTREKKRTKEIKVTRLAVREQLQVLPSGSCLLVATCQSALV